MALPMTGPATGPRTGSVRVRLEDAAMQGKGRSSRRVFDHLDGGGVTRVDLHGVRNAVADDAIDTKQAA